MEVQEKGEFLPRKGVIGLRSKMQLSRLRWLKRGVGEVGRIAATLRLRRIDARRDRQGGARKRVHGGDGRRNKTGGRQGRLTWAVAAG
jgi:hypothetical protein